MTKLFKHSHSLNATMVYTILFSLALSFALYFSITSIGKLAIEKIYMSPDNVASRKAEIYSDLNNYVVLNDISGQDSAALANFTGSNNFITILIYNKNGDLILRAARGEAQSSSNMQTYQVLQYAVEFGKLYPMRFSDGVYNVAIGDYTQKKEENLIITLAVTLSVICFFSILLMYIRRLSDRIVQLSKEAVEIGEGDLERPISLTGNDELTMLAKEVDNMRSSVIERMGNERKAWEANSELITAISHDIRTPMTSLIGYLELLSSSDFKDVERCRQFCSSACGKAAELKELTDELFKYFLVFGKAHVDMNIETFEANFLIEQLLTESEYELMDIGFKVNHVRFDDECLVRADAMYLKRVVSNLISNIKKYADRSRSVVLMAIMENDTVSVCFSNSVEKAKNRVESTKLGIRTCQKIMEHMGGNFIINKDEDHFAAEFSLPIVKDKV